MSKFDNYSDGPVWDHFGLSYAAYYCVPRVALCAMPLEWQEKFIELVKQLPNTPTYRCLRVGKDGRFEKDEYRNYRHPSLELLNSLRKVAQ